MTKKLSLSRSTTYLPGTWNFWLSIIFIFAFTFLNADAPNYRWGYLDQHFFKASPSKVVRATTLDNAKAIANGDPNITHFFYVHDEIAVITWEGEYADSDVEYYPAGYAQFYSGNFNAAHRNTVSGNVTAYFKMTIPYKPIHTYEKVTAYNYSNNFANESDPVKDPYLVSHNLDLDEAYKIADEDPEITYFQYWTRDCFHLLYNDESGKGIYKENREREVLFYSGHYAPLLWGPGCDIYLKR